MGTPADVLRVATAELGYVETKTAQHPNGNVTKYWAELAPSLQGKPWCDTFTVWVYLHAGVTPTSRAFGVWTTLEAYRRASQLVDLADAHPGDQVIFRIGEGHTGILESIDHVRRTVTCVEGNTSPGVKGSQTNGGGVYRRTRTFADVAGVGRPKFVQEPTVPKHNPPWVFEPIVFDMACPTGGAWLLAASGAVYAVGGAPFRDWTNRVIAFAGKTADHLELPDPARGEAKDGHAYVIVSTDDRRYAP